MGAATIVQTLKEFLLGPQTGTLVLLGTDDDAHGQTLLGYARCSEAAKDLQDVADILPAPVCLLGAYAPSREEALRAAANLATSGLAGSACFAAHGEDGRLAVTRLRADGTAGPLLELHSVPSFDEWLKGHRILRCEVPLRLEVVEDGTADLTRSLHAAVQGAVRHLEAPGLSYMAECGPPGNSTRALLRPGDSSEVGSLLCHPSTASRAVSGSTAAAAVLRCSPLLDTTALCPPPEAPTFTYSPLATATNSTTTTKSSSSKATCRTVTLRLDVLCYAPAGSSVGWAVGALSGALVRQARAAARVLAERGELVPVRALHFLPPGLSHHLTLLQPALHAEPEANDAALLPARQRMHALLGLPPNRPLLRSANAVDPASGGGAEGDGEGGGVARLRDVHAGLTPPAIGGPAALLQGSYEYCHYMQDRFNDSGWGCAYRSLQTIVSWFRLQGYTGKPIPSHKAMQQILVRLDDKPPSFVGSSNWIGAIELSYILDEYLGVSCKVLTVNRGSDIPSHARQLAAHFAEVGTPVMIGGGVLAYTLLGVRFDEGTGEAAFLILDPHYTGGEDLKKIQQGTWVGWKRPGDNAAAGGPLFVDDAFYNFLLPQRPQTV